MKNRRRGPLEELRNIIWEYPEEGRFGDIGGDWSDRRYTGLRGCLMREEGGRGGGGGGQR